MFLKFQGSVIHQVNVLAATMLDVLVVFTWCSRLLCNGSDDEPKWLASPNDYMM